MKRWVHKHTNETQIQNAQTHTLLVLSITFHSHPHAHVNTGMHINRHRTLKFTIHKSHTSTTICAQMHTKHRATKLYKHARYHTHKSTQNTHTHTHPSINARTRSENKCRTCNATRIHFSCVSTKSFPKVSCFTDVFVCNKYEHMRVKASAQHINTHTDKK